MHILVINDDGPPSKTASPYVHCFINALRARGHQVSVVLPHVQRSWIGKAHFVHETAVPTYFRPGTVHEDDGTTHDQPLPPGADGDEWVLVDGTPATCAQLGIFHFYKDRGPVDLVVSGPNFGRNSTSLFSLSSGTIGGAMEASCCGYKAVALSFAFSREVRYKQEFIEAACRLGAKLSEHLGQNWDKGVDLYNINIPLVPNLETNKVYWTKVLQNFWRSGSSYQPTDTVGAGTSEDKEANRRSKEGSDAPASGSMAPKTSEFSRHEHRNFKWVPSFADINESVKGAPAGTDGWAILHDSTSVTPLKANFMHAATNEGELKLDGKSETAMTSPTIQLNLDYDDEYVQPLIQSAVMELIPSCTTTARPLSDTDPNTAFLQISQYESINHEQLFKRPTTYLANSNIIRKALIRKEYLASVVTQWTTKNPQAVLSKCLPETVSIHVDYAEFLDDALLEGDGITLMPVMAKNAGVDPVDRSWYIVKASMADRGQGIQLFSTYEELERIFEEWEVPSKDGSEAGDVDINEDGDESTTKGLGSHDDHNGDAGEGMASSLRHFVLQRYIEPLLLPSKDNRKFHIRCYVLAVGALKVYVYHDMLALFSAKSYHRPDDGAETLDLATHLTNTCLQDGTREGSVERFWDLPELDANPAWKSLLWDDICQATGELFQAAKAAPTDFQPLPNAFELYGVDWLVGQVPGAPDGELQPWLLEVNAFPDLKQTGDELKDVIGNLWKGVITASVAPFFKTAVEGNKKPGDFGLTKVLDVDMQR